MKKNILLSVISLLFALIVVEIGFRVFFSFKVGPSVLLYGIRERQDNTAGQDADHTVKFHDNVVGKYAKYFPNQTRVDHDENGEIFKVTINSKGFRGKDFSTEKEPGIIRVVTLGASSTFGYYDREDETYPYYMEQILNSQCESSRSFEVINLGIPHLTSEQILSLFLNEAVQLDPDVVTYYEGNNEIPYVVFGSEILNDKPDTVQAPKKKRSLLSRTYAALVDHLLIANYIHQVRMSQFTKYSKEFVHEKTKDKSGFYLKNISLIHEECRKRSIIFILANQQGKSDLFKKENIKGVTYKEEVGIIEEKLSKQGYLDTKEAFFLIHNALMDDLKTWALANDLHFIDIIESMDQDRDVLLSWVHLNPEGNRIIAEAFARGIISRVCPGETETYRLKERSD